MPAQLPFNLVPPIPDFFGARPRAQKMFNRTTQQLPLSLLALTLYRMISGQGATPGGDGGTTGGGTGAPPPPIGTGEPQPDTAGVLPQEAPRPSFLPPDSLSALTDQLRGNAKENARRKLGEGNLENTIQSWFAGMKPYTPELPGEGIRPGYAWNPTPFKPVLPENALLSLDTQLEALKRVNESQLQNQINQWATGFNLGPGQQTLPSGINLANPPKPPTTTTPAAAPLNAPATGVTYDANGIARPPKPPSTQSTYSLGGFGPTGPFTSPAASGRSK